VQLVAVVGAIGQKSLTLDKDIEHVAGAASVMGQAFSQVQSDRQVLGVNQCMDLASQLAARATMQPDQPAFFCPWRSADARG
jgi:hypothetical protein